MVVQHITEQSANTAVTDPIAELLAITSTLSSAPDDVVSQAAILLPSEELDTLERDIPMEEPLEARGLLGPPKTKELVMQGAHGSPSSHSPHPQIWQDCEDIDEPALGLN
jgi:hypothetical protein